MKAAPLSAYLKGEGSAMERRVMCEKSEKNTHRSHRTIKVYFCYLKESLKTLFFDFN